MHFYNSICARPNCPKPVYVEPDGFTHPYCGKTCASIARSFAIHAVGKCSNSFCHRPRYADNDGTIFDYCGRTCANRSRARVIIQDGRDNGKNENDNIVDVVDVPPVDINVTVEGNSCSVSDYPRERYTVQVDPTPSDLEGPSKEIDSSTTTKITSVSVDDLDYIRISSKFMKALPNIRIQGILRLQMPKKIVDAHMTLRNKRPVRQMYHGTYAICDLKNLIKCKRPQCNPPSSIDLQLNTRLVNNYVNISLGRARGMGIGREVCGVCGIIREGNSTKFSNHGGQMWFARNPSVSIQYTGGKYKAIFCVDVVTDEIIGNTFGFMNNGYAIINTDAVSISMFNIYISDVYLFHWLLIIKYLFISLG